MGIGANTLDFIRGIFKQSNYERLPYVPPVGYQGIAGQVHGYGYGAQSQYGGLSDTLKVDSELVARFVDYEDMDDNPLVSSAFDIYAEDATQIDHQENKTIWIKCEDGDIKKDLEDLLYRRLKIEERVWADLRTLVKYGNFYAEIVAKDQIGVVALNAMPPPTVRRIEIPKEIGQYTANRMDLESDTLGFIYDPRGLFRLSTPEFIGQLQARVTGMPYQSPSGHTTGSVFESWEVMHCRLNGKNANSVYGFSIADGGRWIFKRLIMLEDSIIMHRLTRAPSRYAFYIDVSQIPPQETAAYLNRVKQALKKQKFVNPNSGKFDLKYNPLEPSEDFFLPVRDGKESTKVESLAGPVYDHIEDVKFFEDKLFAALKIPKPFLTYEQTTAKTHLSAEDARFARSVMRVQREYMNGVRKVCAVHLAARGLNPDLIDFEINMSVPSAIFELAQLEIRNAELELAEKFGEWAPKRWIMTNILGFSDEEISEMEVIAKQEEEGGVEAPSSSASGSIERAASKRGTPAIATPVEPEVASKKTPSDKVLMTGIKKNSDNLLERVDTLRTQNKDFDRKLTEMQSFMREIQTRLPRR